MRFNHLDLNLLVALDALLDRQSIALAAERLHLSASATSNALARLRDYFDDELLIRVGRRMELTPRADTLKDVVRDILVRIEAGVDTAPQFDPLISRRRFRIYASDYVQCVLAPHLLALASQSGSRVGFDFLAIEGHPERNLERGDVDLLIIPKGFESAVHPSEELYEEDLVCIYWRRGPHADQPLSMDRYVEADHVVMTPEGGQVKSFDSLLMDRYGVKRRIAATTYSFAAMPALLSGTSYLATVHRRLAGAFASCWELDVCACPVPVGSMHQLSQWHKQRAHDSGLAWLRRLLRSAVERMDTRVPLVCGTEKPSMS